MAVTAGSRKPVLLAPVHCAPKALSSPSTSNCPSLHHRELFLLRRVDLRISEIESPIASTIAAATCSRLNHLLSDVLLFRQPRAAAVQEVRRLALVQPQAASVSRVEILLAGSPALGDAVRSDVLPRLDFYSIPRVCCLIWINLIDLLGRFAHDAGHGARVTVSAR
jgi:hypothetical protein